MNCTGTTQAGNPCKASPLKGTDRCRRHPAPDTADGSTRGQAPGPDRGDAWDRQAWLDAFEEHITVTAACMAVGVGRSTVYDERQRNPVFAEAWSDVEDQVVEKMEAEAYRRAVDGVSEPMVSAGELVAHRQVFSDGLLQFLLKARRPTVYRERLDVNAHHAGTLESKITVDLSRLSDAELEQLEKLTAKLES